MPYWSTVITRKEQFDNPIVRLVGAAFTVFGIGALIIALLVGLSSSNQHHDWIETEAVITGFEQDGFPDVTYSVGGQEYTVRLGNKSTNQHLGDAAKVRYNPKDPGDATSTPDWFLPVLFGGLGLIFSGLGITFLCLARKARKMALSADQADSAETDDFTENDDTKHLN